VKGDIVGVAREVGDEGGEGGEVGMAKMTHECDVAEGAVKLHHPLFQSLAAVLHESEKRVGSEEKLLCFILRKRDEAGINVPEHPDVCE
jgi:hypothetical protein